MHTKRLAAAGFAMVVALAACSAPGGSTNRAAAAASRRPRLKTRCSAFRSAASRRRLIPIGRRTALDHRPQPAGAPAGLLRRRPQHRVRGRPGESWDLREDGQTVTFHLKEGIKYSDGSDIVAADFVTSWRRLIDPRTAADYYYVMLDIDGAADVAGADPDDDAASTPPWRTSASRRRTTRRSSSICRTRPATSSRSPRCGSPRPARGLRVWRGRHLCVVRSVRDHLGA